MVKNKRHISIVSILLSMATFGFLGYNIALRLQEELSINSIFFYFIIGVSLMIAFIFAYFTPKAAEGFSMALAFLLMVQAGWDWIVRDWSNKRSMIFITSSILFLINLFTGELRLRFAKQVARRQIGLS